MEPWLNSYESAKYRTFPFHQTHVWLSVIQSCHPERGNTKNGTTGVPARITTGRGTEGPENGTTRQTRDGWQRYR